MMHSEGHGQAGKFPRRQRSTTKVANYKKDMMPDRKAYNIPIDWTLDRFTDV